MNGRDMSPEEFVKSRRGFKRQDIDDCLLCGKGLMHNNDLDFYRVTLDRFFLDHKAIARTHGMETMMGGGQMGAVLTNILGPDPNLALAIDDQPHSFLVCGTCSLHNAMLIAIMAEAATRREEEREDKRAANKPGRDEGSGQTAGQPDQD